MSQLHIYRASAGSGKTYTLTGEFLHLVFKDPLSYKNILAVTFTNKATDEMKSRILKEIHVISSGEDSPYEKLLCENNNLNAEQLQKRANEILNRLLHDYSRFSVTTIDSFFQKVVRSFTREIGLQMGYNIELDQGRVLSDVVDLLLQDVDSDQQLRNWLSSFAESKIRDGKTWNFKQDILNLGGEVFKEDFQNFSNSLIEKLSDKKFLGSYRKILNEIKEEFEQFFLTQSEEVERLLQNNSLDVSDFSYGKTGVAGYLSGLGKGGKYEPGARARAAVDNPKKWVASKASKETKMAVEGAVSSGLNDILKKVVNYYDEQSMLYNSTEKTLSYIYTLGILTDLSKKVREYSESENIFLLSDASRLLRNIIGSNDSPFIYEKIGNVYKHFMIDEFQDTSSMQWDNFRPLVGNSLAEDQHSLVVGDVKQSIYRWRNGDWKLLANQLDTDFQDFGVNGLSLNYNWRSTKNVIDFNNSIFALGAQILQNNYNESIPNEISERMEDEKQKIVNAYKDVYQHYPSNNEKRSGYVKALFLEKESESDWMEQVLEDLPIKIEELQLAGYNARDIAILVRNGKEGGMIADTLMSYRASENAKETINYDVISNDSLYLKNSSVVNFLMHLLHYLVYPEDKINIGFLKQEYQLYVNESVSKASDGLYLNDEENLFGSIFPQEFQEQLNELKRQPLYDLTEKLIKLFELNKNSEDYPFLEAFQDLVLGFTKSDSPDLNSFVHYWEERKDKEVISVSDEQDAIRIMTIHKSKGLEFKTVILPFANWDLDNTRHTNILWCQPKVEGFDVLDVLPVRYSSTLRDTIYYQEYFEEKLQSFIDNLNLLYVAQTRAEEVFISYSPITKNKDLKTVADLLLFAFRNSAEFSSDFYGDSIISLNEHWNEEGNCFELGELPSIDQKTETELKEKAMDYPASLLDERLKLRSHSADYFDFSEAESVESFTPVSRGNILHQLFQLIEYAEDVEKAVEQLQFEGKLDKAQASEVSEFARELLSDPKVAQWFSKEWQVINERDILKGNGEVYRPDRVIKSADKAIVIDYKFGKKKEKSHQKQVAQYKKLVESLGVDHVEGYVLYGKLSEIVAV
ncbi:UvrD-helicase domain-containing protein [Marinifilum caeruleilacunae]|uniref:DNA 3'-5' helicase n=1 Tax=Marinifilum caeruleilacunae TaxID=2499076 RepID=A0ABX1WT16_9BACT|nr:UvrD-helicase domain-containing protein [Marinifilum caeruleilacunae]NOU59247.1 Dna2/Cas4 domain-containing protein [Marinifilum caeruleilacunae]